jgi:hypothetical protein
MTYWLGTKISFESHEKSYWFLNSCPVNDERPFLLKATTILQYRIKSDVDLPRKPLKSCFGEKPLFCAMSFFSASIQKAYITLHYLRHTN